MGQLLVCWILCLFPIDVVSLINGIQSLKMVGYIFLYVFDAKCNMLVLNLEMKVAKVVTASENVVIV